MENLNNLNNIENIPIIFKVSNYEVKEKNLKNLTLLKTNRNNNELPLFWESDFGKNFKPLKMILKMLFRKRKINNITQEHYNFKELVKKRIKIARNFYKDLCKETIKNNLNKVNSTGDLINLNEEEEKTKNELIANISKIMQMKKKYIKTIRKFMKNLPSFWRSQFGEEFTPLKGIKKRFKKNKNNLTKEENELNKLIEKLIDNAKNFYDGLCEKTSKNNLVKVNSTGNLINLNEEEEKTKNELTSILNKLKKKYIRPILKPIKKRKPMTKYRSFWDAEIGQHCRSLINLKYKTLKKCKKEQKSLTKKQKNLIKLIDSKINTVKNFYNELCESTNKDDPHILDLKGNLINIEENEEEIKNDLINFLNEINELKQEYVKTITKPLKKRNPMKNLPSFWDAPISQSFKPLINLKYNNILRKCKEKQKTLTKKQKDLIKLIDSILEKAKNFYNDLCEKTTKNNLNRVDPKGNLINLNEEEEKTKNELTTVLNALKEKHVRSRNFTNKLTKKRGSMKNLPHFWASSFGKKFKPLQNKQRKFYKKRKVELTKEESNLKELIEDTIYNAKIFYDLFCEKTNKKVSKKVNSKGNPINLNKDEKRTQNNLLKILNEIKEKHIRPKQK